MNKKDKTKLFKDCLTKWGSFSQICMCIEEMGELTQALCKSIRYEKSDDFLTNIYEEIADVSIMLEQMIILFDGDISVKKIIEKKLERLKETLKNES